MEIKVFVEIHTGCACCMDEQDNHEILRAVCFVEKVKKEFDDKVDIKIFPDFSVEYMPYSKGKHKLPLITLDGKIVSEGEYPDIAMLKTI